MNEPLPAGYAERRYAGGWTVVARADALDFVLAALREAGSLHGYALAHAARRLGGGRGVVAVLERGGEGWAVRHCWRGGGMARLLGDRYLRTGRPRPLAELRVQAALSARRIATPAVVAAVVQRRGIWYRGDVATELVAGAADLAELTLGPARWPEAERQRAWQAAGALLRQFFATGAIHADLNLRNIVVQRATAAAWLLDLDRCVLAEGARERPESVARMLRRFHRSRRKLERAAGEETGAAELAAFERAVAARATGEQPAAEQESVL